MSDQNPPEGSLADEIQALGKNLSQALRSVWDTPERKRVQEQVTNSLTDLSTTLKREAENLATSPASQQLKSEFAKVGERVRSSEAQEKVRGELVNVLRMANSELQKVIDRWATETPAANAPEADDKAPSGGDAAEAAEEPAAQPAENAPDTDG